ncbi:hypothetical protein D9758_016260 [Tetrapyrgos nigripes]|uniref:MFS general substrate transporter n=1 Tax=Tetrapyrgos nigripes TaxID=182062 RepID=A0A8H5BYT6_9AGAR|nr:hypothetical protein D9758_016260 [Tetrapyrgos nigripes]
MSASPEPTSPISEKIVESSLGNRYSDKDEDNSVETIISSADGDEALKLVGKERTTQFTEEYNRRLRRKLDFVIPPLCAAVYFTQFLDKTSMNYASIMGLPVIGQNYNLVSMAFYLGFLFWEFPTVYISQKTRIAKYLGVNIVVWGTILMLHAVASSFGAFFVLRFLLGMCESCVAPILVIIISMFYKKDEQATRISWYIVMNGLTQIFGGFVAYGVSFDDGRHLAPYKIIFVLLGGLAIVVGIAVLIWMPDSPVLAQFLTTEERIAALERVRDDQGGTENKTLKMDQVKETLTDVRTWLIVLTTILTNIPNGALTSFSNIIIKGFGYSSRQTLVLSTPGGAVASAMVLFCGWYSDKKNERMTPIVIAIIPTIIGAAIMIGLNHSGNKGGLLFAIYLINTFGSSGSAVYSWNASNTAGHTKKSTLNALTMFTFAVGNIIGTEIFQPKDAPDYIPGKIAIMTLMTVQLFVCFLLRYINIRMNKKKAKLLEEEKARRGWTDEDVQKEREKHAFFGFDG